MSEQQRRVPRGPLALASAAPGDDNKRDLVRGLPDLGAALAGWRPVRTDARPDASPPSVLVLVRPADDAGDAGDAVVAIDAFELPSAAAAHEHMARVLAEFQSPLLHAVAGVADVAVGHGDTAVVARHANVVFVVRNAGADIVAVLPVAQAVDAILRDAGPVLADHGRRPRGAATVVGGERSRRGRFGAGRRPRRARHHDNGRVRRRRGSRGGSGTCCATTRRCYRYERPGVPPCWVVTRYDDVKQVERRPDVFVNAGPILRLDSEERLRRLAEFKVRQAERWGWDPDEPLDMVYLDRPEHIDFRHALGAELHPRVHDAGSKTTWRRWPVASSPSSSPRARAGGGRRR